jgi:hypothetical protein
MKPLLLIIPILLTSCAGYKTTFFGAYETPDGQRFEGSVAVEPSGKQVVGRGK